MKQHSGLTLRKSVSENLSEPEAQGVEIHIWNFVANAVLKWELILCQDKC